MREFRAPEDDGSSALSGLTKRMSYRRPDINDANLAHERSQTERLAAVSSIRLVRLSHDASEEVK